MLKIIKLDTFKTEANYKVENIKYQSIYPKKNNF